ncbi:hypothetical protein [Spirillospora sp. CA-128828]|uniref:hypothetical protein n=1 Tax=Spirillospora sp. CA-128828 TaxID=3240033 RepID=UPI003D8F277A
MGVVHGGRGTGIALAQRLDQEMVVHARKVKASGALYWQIQEIRLRYRTPFLCVPQYLCEVSDLSALGEMTDILQGSHDSDDQVVMSVCGQVDTQSEWL